MGNPIFVRGLSRSGGTLVVTLLDSHPDIAMSYEQYPNLLEIDAGTDEKALIEGIRSAKTSVEARALCPTPRMGTYIVRYDRGGLSHQDFADHLEQLHDEGADLQSEKGRLRMMEIGGLMKMNRQNKSHWGMKMIGDYQTYLDTWPDCRVINVMRDGRDVMASQINNMSGGKTPAKVAKGWASSHRKFRKFQAKFPKHAHEVRYENLVRNPEVEIRKICEFVGLPFSDLMLNHDKQDLTIHNANHLSGARVAKPIDDSQVGRWKKEMTQEQVSEFMEVVGDALAEYGYE